jgi:hypothetical protein
MEQHLAFVDVASLRGACAIGGSSAAAAAVVEQTLTRAYSVLGPASSSLRFVLADISYGGKLAERLSTPGCAERVARLRLQPAVAQESLGKPRRSLCALATSSALSVLLAARDAGANAARGWVCVRLHATAARACVTAAVHGRVVCPRRQATAGQHHAAAGRFSSRGAAEPCGSVSWRSLYVPAAAAA